MSHEMELTQADAETLQRCKVVVEWFTGDGIVAIGEYEKLDLAGKRRVLGTLGFTRTGFTAVPALVPGDHRNIDTVVDLIHNAAAWGAARRGRELASDEEARRSSLEQLRAKDDLKHVEPCARVDYVHTRWLDGPKMSAARLFRMLSSERQTEFCDLIGNPRLCAELLRLVVATIDEDHRALIAPVP